MYFYYIMDIGVANRKSPSYSDKWRFSIYSALVVLIVFNPWTYKLVNSLLSGLVGSIAKDGCPTPIGFAIHLVVFTLIVRYMMDLNL
jgi:hypothetical protein